MGGVCSVGRGTYVISLLELFGIVQMIADGCADKAEQQAYPHSFQLYSSTMQLHSAAPRYMRHHNYSITPLPESSDEDDHHYENTTYDTRLCNTSGIEPLSLPLKKKIVRRLSSSKSRASKSKEIVELQWDEFLRPSATAEYRAVNKQLKRETIQQIQRALGRWQLDTRVIVFQGPPQTGKKTIMESVLDEKCIKNYYLDFSNNALPLRKKVKQLQLFIESLQSKSRIQELTEQKTTQNQMGGPTAIVINSYTTFLSALRRRQERLSMKKLLSSSRNVILIGISSDTGVKGSKLLADITQTIRMAANSKEYFLQSLLSAVHSSPFLTHQWLLARPLANFFSTKMEQAAQLSLQTITRLLTFLNTQPHSEGQPQRLTRDILQSFQETISRHCMKVDLQRLSIHEKCILVACYTELQEGSAILVEEKKLMKTYEWVCSSLQITPKSKKEVRADLLYQLETYQLIRSHPAHSHKNTLLTIDLPCIRSAYSNDFLLAKFFS